LKDNLAITLGYVGYSFVLFGSQAFGVLNPLHPYGVILTSE
jgi:hypothetical protein